MKIFIRMTVVALLLAGIFPMNSLPASATGELKAFPQHTTYTAGTIKPNNVTQTQMDDAVKLKYDEWKSRYLKQNPDALNQYYVFYNLEGLSSPTNAVSSSEGHGYGMLATVIMAGYDANAKTYFDSLYAFYKAHPSVNNAYGMAWQQIKDSGGHIVNNPSGGNDSATDGDMDIAYALLLADKQWGSSGTIDYLTAGKNAINGIMSKDVNSTEWILKLGDWAANTDATYGTGTRPSDFMLSHLKAYQNATGDANWGNVATKTYSIINSLKANYSSSTGLLPDFAHKVSASYVPAPSNYLEATTDGDYSYNSCRTPWRIPIDYLLTGDTTALSQLTTLNSWIKTKTASNPSNVKDGYQLNGTALSGTSYSMAFAAPFAVSAMIDSSNQTWLNSLWSNMANTSSSAAGMSYYENSIRLLSMITVSGNWWSPTSSGPTPTPTPTPTPIGNLALGKTYTASTTWSPSYIADKAFDGDVSTRWSASSGSLNNQWINVDFGTATTFNQAVIKEITLQRVSSYKLQSSTDGITYSDISGTLGTSIGSSKTINFAPVTSRYLRLYVNTATDVPTINEIEVYSHPNLAINKTYNASTTWSASYTAAQAFDGNDSTRWSASSGSLNNQWISVDFGTATTYNQTVIKEISLQRVTSYKLQSSDDGITYTDITGASGTTLGASKTVSFAPVTSRYIRLYVNTATDVPTINEIELYNN